MTFKCHSRSAATS